MSIRSNLATGAFEWLIAILLSWWIPFQLFGEFTVTYFVSLLLWAVPVALLFPRFLRSTHRGSRRRQAFWITAAIIFVLGVALDFVFGAKILDFRCGERGVYRWDCLPGVGGRVPVEEVLFYLLGAWAVLLIYSWADQHWLSLYNVRRRRSLRPEPGHLIDLSWRVAGLGLTLWLAGVTWKVSYGHGWLPRYYTFLVIAAFLPMIALYRGVSAFVNWRALSYTGLYIMLTAAVWEVTLALPKGWWFYKVDGMVGKGVLAWSTVRMYPIEALIVWIMITFVAVLFYEAAEAYFYDDRPAIVRLFTGLPDINGPVFSSSPATESNQGISVVVQSSRGDSGNAGLALGLVLAAQVLDGEPFEMIVVAGDEAYEAHYGILCFTDEHIMALPHAYKEIRSVLDSPRIIGGSTSAMPERFGEIVRWILRRPYAWMTAIDDGIVFCRAGDFATIRGELRKGTKEDILRNLRVLGSKTRRVLTRLPDDGVRYRPDVLRVDPRQ